MCVKYAMIRKNKHITEGLLVQYLRDELSFEAKAEIELWLAESNENLQTFERVKKFWEASASLKHWMTTNAETEWQAFRENMDLNRRYKKVYLSGPRIISILAAAAIALLVTIMVFPGIRGQQVYLSENQVRTIDLEDGTMVMLNKYSSLTVDRKFGTTARKVQLQGEAFFEVSPDKQKPFYIKTTDAYIRVVGTSFNVAAYSKTHLTEVTVRSGVVEVKNKARTKTVMLQEGHKALVNSHTDTINAVRADNFNELAWRTHKLTFRNTPLERVCRQLTRTYSQRVIIGNEQLKNCRISVTFENQTLESALNVISETLAVRVDKRGNEYHLTGNGCQ